MLPFLKERFIFSQGNSIFYAIAVKVVNDELFFYTQFYHVRPNCIFRVA